jgi:hypothetical protein
MKRISITCLLLAFIHSNAYSFQNEPDGFGGIKWGTEVGVNVHEMWSTSISTTNSDIVTYERKKENQSIGSMKLLNVGYVYYKDRFSYTHFQSDNKQALIKTLNSYYGAGEKLAPELDYYLWHGVATVIALRCEPVGAVCYVRFYSSRYLQELNVTMPHAIAFDKKLIDMKAKAIYASCSNGFEKSASPADVYYVECEAQRYKTWESGLEQLSSEFLSRLGPHCHDKLEQAQAEWKTLRDLDFPLSNAIFNIRVGNAQKSVERRTAYVVERVDYLLSLFYATQNADPFDPKIRECILFRAPGKPVMPAR